VYAGLNFFRLLGRSHLSIKLRALMASGDMYEGMGCPSTLLNRVPEELSWFNGSVDIGCSGGTGIGAVPSSDVPSV